MEGAKNALKERGPLAKRQGGERRDWPEACCAQDQGVLVRAIQMVHHLGKESWSCQERYARSNDSW